MTRRRFDPVAQTARFIEEFERTTKQSPATVSRRGPYSRNRELRDVVWELLADIEGPVSTRQLFYLLISHGSIDNSARSYTRVQRLIVDMRRAGDLDYSRIVDRTRARHALPGWDGVRDLLESAQAQYRQNYWASQATVVQVACEKAALEGVLGAAVDEFGAELWTIRGFISESFAFEWAEHIKRLTAIGKRVTIGYFGDMDPSGLAIEQDARTKLRNLGATVTWSRQGLLWNDFTRFNLIELPVKKNDTRHKPYLKYFGNRAAELDALPPNELKRRVRAFIHAAIDQAAWQRVEAIEAAERETLENVAGNWEAITRRLANGKE